MLDADPDDLIGSPALDAAHRPLGTVEEVLVAASTGELEFVVLGVDRAPGGRRGGTRLIPVPLTRARLHDDGVVLQYTHAEVLSAPELDPEAESLGPQGKQRVLAHFGESGAVAPGPSVSAADDAPTTPTTPVPIAPGVPPAPPAASHPTPPRASDPPLDAGAGEGDETEVVVNEERLSVEITRVPVERVRLRKVVVVEAVTITVELRREELVVEREPIEEGDAAAGSGDARLGEESFEFVLHAEEPVVQKRLVPAERVRIVKGSVVERHEIESERRKEHVDVDHEEMP